MKYCIYFFIRVFLYIVYLKKLTCYIHKDFLILCKYFSNHDSSVKTVSGNIYLSKGYISLKNKFNCVRGRSMAET